MANRIFLVSLFLLLSLPSYSFSDEHKGSKNLQPVKDEFYKKTCGVCHFAYQPGLLPERSWKKMIDTPGAHPGGDIALDARTKEKIRKYLVQNSAENSPSKRSRKILSSIDSSSVPLKISEIPYIKHKHSEISQKVFNRESIRSRGNCIACHRKADQGIYEDDDVVIPPK